MKLFEFGGSLTKKQNTIAGVVGGTLLLLLWFLFTAAGVINPMILPNPIKVMQSIPGLFVNNNLLGNIGYTVGLNLLGYLLALVVAIPLGFVIGIYPVPSGMFKPYLEAVRYLPLPTVSGIFITIFGLGFGMKAEFLAFGIFIFTLPSIVQKITDLQNPKNVLDNVYLQTAKTLGMSNWQTFKFVYWPYVMDRIYGDIRSLVAISYTYVVIAECLNKEGGIGALISTFTRQARTPEIYALLFIIVGIGIFQDWVFKKLDPVFFPHHRR